MFVYYYAIVAGVDAGEVEEALVEILRDRPQLADVAYREGEELRARLGVDGHRVAKSVRLQVGRPFRGTEETTIPITWEATGTPALFPRMDGELMVASIAPDVVQMALRGSYRPPLGAVGRVADRAVLHRIAEASIKGFVDRLAGALAERSRATAGGRR